MGMSLEIDVRKAAYIAIIVLVLVVLFILGSQFLSCYNSGWSELAGTFTGQSKFGYCISQLP